MLSLFFRNLFFTLLQPGIVAGLVPYLLIKKKVDSLTPQSFNFSQYAGIAVLFIGLSVMLTCIFSFATKGKGTLSPADPTKQLVVTGLYKYSRNPMYVGVILILIGEALFFKSTSLWIYAAIIFIAFNLFIIFFEEPRLRKDFGIAYQLYCKKTRRWI